MFKKLLLFIFERQLHTTWETQIHGFLNCSQKTSISSEQLTSGLHTEQQEAAENKKIKAKFPV